MKSLFTLILCAITWSSCLAKDVTGHEILKSQDAVQTYMTNLATSSVRIQTVSLHPIGTDDWLNISRTNDLISFSLTTYVAGMKGLEKGAVFSISSLDPNVTADAWVAISETKIDRIKSFVLKYNMRIDDNWWSAKNQKGEVTSSMRKIIFYCSGSRPELSSEAVVFLITEIFESKIANGIEASKVKK